MNLIKRLKQPHPFIFNKGSVLLPGILTTSLFLIFQPFGFWQLPFVSKAGFSILLGFIVMLNILSVVYLSKRLLPKWTKKENWTLGKELVLFLLVTIVITIVIFLFILILGLSNLPTALLFQSVVLKTIMISLFPILVVVLFEQNSHRKTQLQRATKLNKELEERNANTPNVPNTLQEILFTTEKGKVVLKLQPHEVLFLKSDGNYVEVFYTVSPKKTSKKLIRNRLKNIISLLPQSVFFHCHKRYVINVHHVIAVEGNARNFELSIRNWNDSIPVSRTNAEALSGYLKQNIVTK